MNRSQRRSLKGKSKYQGLSVTIGVPSLEQGPMKFAMAFGAMMFYTGKHAPGIQIIIANKIQQPTDKSRREIADIVESHKTDLLFSLDSDMVFPPDTLIRLIDEDKDIIGGNYARRDKLLESTAIGLDGQRLSPKEMGVVAVKGIGMGIVLIKRKVFERLDKPYFLFTHDPNKTPPDLSEDFYFCNKARQAGFTVYCHGSLSRELVHTGYEEFKLP